MDTIFNKLHRSKFILKVDLKKACHQILLSKKVNNLMRLRCPDPDSGNFYVSHSA